MSGILLYGGTFNPIHPGHIAVCRQAAALLSPEKILLMPTASPPHKIAPDLAPGEDRLAMCRAASMFLPGAVVSDYEVANGGKSYTIDTLEHLADEYPGEKLYLLVGTDMFLTFEEWRRWREIGRLATVVAASRRTDDLAAMEAMRTRLLAEGVPSVLLHNNALVLSSTELRAELHSGGFSPRLDPAVMGCIWMRGLYGCSERDRTPEALRAIVKGMVSEKRYLHTLGVEKASVYLAQRYGADPDKARTAGILHDVCKGLDRAAALQLIAGSDIISDINFPDTPNLLHSFAGAEYIKLLGVTDPDIVNAVRYHTTGRAGMSRLEMCVYLGDMISEERDYPDVDAMRAAADVSLESGMAYALSYQMPYLKSKGYVIYSDTRAACRQYCNKTEEEL